MSCGIVSDGSDVIGREICSLDIWKLSADYIPSSFCLEATIAWILNNNFHKIGLQFPDDLLSVSSIICELLSVRTSQFCFVLGDTSFASCCVDEVVGQRLQIDALIHYGSACLSKTTNNLPIFYVFGRLPSSYLPNSSGYSALAEQVHRGLQSDSSVQSLLITYDFRYQNFAFSLCERLMELVTDKSIYWSEPCLPPDCRSFSATPTPFGMKLPPISFTKCGRTFHLLNSSQSNTQPNSWSVLYIGRKNCADDNLLSFNRILISLPQVSFLHAYYLDTDSLQLDMVGNVIKQFIKRRSYLIEKAKDAQRVGILVGTLSVGAYNCIISRVQCLLKRAGLFYLTLMVGRLNPAKLANFPELDLLVLIACPETSLLNSRDYLLPIITPFELECALSSLHTSQVADEIASQKRCWTGERVYVDYTDLLPGGSIYCSEQLVVPDILNRDGGGDVSLITGKLRASTIGRACACEEEEDGDGKSSSAVAVRGSWDIVDVRDDRGGAASRAWYGLEPKLGQTPVAELKQGLHGVPTSYNDVENNDAR